MVHGVVRPKLLSSVANIYCTYNRLHAIITKWCERGSQEKI